VALAVAGQGRGRRASRREAQAVGERSVAAAGAGGGHGLAEGLGEADPARRAFCAGDGGAKTLPVPTSSQATRARAPRGRRPAEGPVVDRWSSTAQVMPHLVASASGQRLRMTFMALVWAALEKVS